MKRTILSILVVYGSLIASASINNEGESRSATVKIDVDKMDVINIEAKYTDLTIEAWDKDEVMIEANVVFDGKMNKRVQEFLDNFESEVSKNIYRNGNEVLIDTNLDEPNKMQIGSKNVGIIFSFSEDELRVEYNIKAPSNNKYIINTSYKETQLFGHFKEIELTQYSGDLTAEFIDKVKLNLKYGSSIFKGIGYAEVEMYEQEFESGRIKELKLDAKYSDLELTEVGILNAKSYETDYQIDSIGNLSGNFKYGEIEVTQEIGTAKLILYEEDIKVRKIERLTLESSKYSKIQLARIESMNIIESYEDELTIGVIRSLVSKNSKYGKYNIEQLQGKFELIGYEDDIEIDDVANSATEIIINGKYINSSINVENVSFQLIGKIKYGELDYNDSTVDVRKYIKDGDELEIEIYSKRQNDRKLQLTVLGYEIDLDLN